ncbi:MAG: FKBP-type peptidyl-prolyl cis-trans isomerase [Saprospiraceae bacterium]|nr:FKBP-type peptidyl-prolyl cis-trans isomerase [Saprospiraceae bacterium]
MSQNQFLNSRNEFPMMYYLSILFLVFICWSCTGDGQPWKKLEGQAFEYRLIADDQLNTDKIAFGDEVEFDYSVKVEAEGKEIRLANLDTASTILEIPAKDNRNEFIEPLLLMREGDSLCMRILSKDAASLVDILPSELQDVQSTIIVEYRVHRVKNQEVLALEREQNYASSKGFLSIEDMYKERDRIRSEAGSVLTKLKQNALSYWSRELKAVQSTGGIDYIIEQEGEGASIQEGDEVYVYFILLAKDEGASFMVLDDMYVSANRFLVTVGNNELIPAWDLALSVLKKGAKAQFFIPADLAYGDGNARIKPNTPLVLALEVVAIQSQPHQ